MSIRYKKKFTVWELLDVLSWLALLGSGYFTDFQYHLMVPSLYLIARGFARRSAIKTDLKNAVDYCRVSKSIPKLILTMTIAIAIGMSFAYGFDYLKLYLPSPDYLDYSYLFVTGFIYTVLTASFLNFTNGLRWYVSGIKLPGERNLLIPWRHISEVRINKGYVFLKALDKQYRFNINPDDYRSALHFVRWFEKKKKHGF